jgi:opacity protein-like surface antigen
MKSMIAGTGIACLISALSANADSITPTPQPFRHFGAPTEYQTSSPREYRSSEYYRPTSNPYSSYEDENTLRYGFGITSVYGYSTTELPGLYGITSPDLGGGIIDFRIELPTESVTHEFSFNISYMEGDITALYYNQTEKLEHDYTSLALGYKIIIPTSETLDLYAGAKLGVSFNEVKYNRWENNRNVETETYKHNCFTPSLLAGLKFNITNSFSISVGYEVFIPTGKIGGVSIDPFHCLTIGVGVMF